jgi:pimeloyl-ACP methyl ester carboxylesterase
LSDVWNPIRRYWSDPTDTNRDALREIMKPPAIRWQYEHGVSDLSAVSPDGYSLDAFYMSRPDAEEIQLDIALDYVSNVALYPMFQAYFRKHQPRFLAIWGDKDPFFLPAGAEAFRRDLPNAEIRLLDAGHFALETHSQEIATAMANFLT